MSEFISVLKTFAFTLVFVLIMQMQLGGSTLEARFEHWVQNSAVTQQFQKAATGASLWCVSNAKWVKDKVEDLWSRNVSQNSVNKEVLSEQKASR